MTWFLVAGAALIPALVMSALSDRQRDRAWAWWLLIDGVLVAVALAVTEPWLGVVTVALLVWWGRSAEVITGRRGGVTLLPVIVSWLAAAGTWYLVRAIPVSDTPVITWAWCLIGWTTAGWMVWERWHVRPEPRAGFGQRMYAGCFFALICCLVPVWAWPGLLVGLFLSGPSWLACLALAAGSVVLWPGVFPWVGSLIVGALSLTLVAGKGPVPVLRWLPRGDSRDSVRQRVVIWRLAVKDLIQSPAVWAVGFGPGTAEKATERWHNGLPPGSIEPLGNFHCEPLEVVYEYGALGLLGLGLFAWRVGGGLTWGDPWSAAAVAAGVMALGTNVSGVIPLGLACLVIWARVAA